MVLKRRNCEGINPMESLCEGVLKRKVHDNNKQFSSANEFKVAIVGKKLQYNINLHIVFLFGVVIIKFVKGLFFYHTLFF